MKNKLSKRYNRGISIIMKRAKKMKKEIGALYFAYKRPDVPFYAKLVSLLVVCYALSPIDLIPDFIPFFGYLDDLIIVPLGVALAIKLIPRDIMNECRQQSESIFKEEKPKKWIAGVIIICIWIIIITYILMKIIHSF